MSEELHQDEFWVGLRPSGKYAHFYKSLYSVTTICGVKKEDLKKVRVHEDPEGDHWGWERSDKPGFCMIQMSEMTLDMCFPDGYKAAAKAGRGRQVRLRVEVIGES